MPAPLLLLGGAAGAGAYAHSKLTGDKKDDDKPPRVKGVKITFWRAMAVVVVVGAVASGVLWAKSRRPMVRH